MLLTPAFEIGIWNAWILQVLFYLSMFIPDIFLDKEARKKSKRMSQFPPFKKTEKILAFSTHAIIMPVVIIYSIFLLLKIGTAGLYAGLPFFAIALVISYRQRHPEKTVFYRVLFHYFEQFVAEYENRFEREYGYFRPVIQEVTAGTRPARPC